jgi:hypothetical protein
MHSNEIEEYKSTLRLSEEQKEVLIGILLGDAALETQNGGRTYRLKIEHSLKQKAYAEHLYKLFNDWARTKPWERKVTLPNGKTYINIVFSTLSYSSLRFYAHQFYHGRTKTVPRLIGKWLTPRAIAYWFMDDGSIKSKQSKGVIFNTHGYQKHEINRLIEVLCKKFHLEAKLRNQKEGYQIYVSGKSYGSFTKLVLPHILPEMTYKIPEARRT